MTSRLLVADVLAGLATLPAASVHCVVTSPPYWGLRDYGVAGQIGLEPTPEEYLCRLVEVFRAVRRVLRRDGTLWLNMGDCYASGGRAAYDDDDKAPLAQGHARRPSTPGGLKSKDLMGMPWRLALSLQADGWWLRRDVVWHKPNPLPESVQDRPTTAHEYLFLLAQAERYYYDAEAVREPHATPLERRATKRGRMALRGQEALRPRGNMEAVPDMAARYYAAGGRNLRSVWTIPTAPYSGAHFATFPPALVEPCVKAGTSERGVCPTCGAPWRRTVERQHYGDCRSGRRDADQAEGSRGWRKTADAEWAPPQTAGWEPSCSCPSADPIPATVLDPFAGAGTTGLVAARLGRSFVGIEINPAYTEMARQRLIADAPLLAGVEVQAA